MDSCHLNQRKSIYRQAQKLLKSASSTETVRLTTPEPDALQFLQKVFHPHRTRRQQMKAAVFFMVVYILLQPCMTTVSAQNKSQPPSQQDIEKVEKLFQTANELMDKGKPAEAILRYKEALAILPGDPSLLFNGGLAAYMAKDYATAADLWKQLKSAEPEDWQVRTKLVQAYQAMGKLQERDAERAELFQLRKTGKITELSQLPHYCREQFEVNKLKVMVFEHFELKGDRALRYAFRVLDEAGDAEAFRISLGSYETTNAIWRETANPKPKAGDRLFHLDGYFKDGHVTYGMFTPEPSYDDIRNRVIKILEAQK
jgi:tetratricopeptide (TPR) repeat protein